MKQRTTPSRRAAKPVEPSTSASTNRKHTTILGIDPSLRGTGYGVIQLSRTGLEYVEAGTLACPVAWERSRCLAKISIELRALVQRRTPTICIVEGIFYAQNFQTAIIMGEARGAALAVVAEAGLEVYEIATRKVKQAIVGYGGAQKLAVARMVQRMLSLSETPAPDAADALALALTHAQSQGRHAALHKPKRI